MLMPWIIEEVENKCYAAKFGVELNSTENYDPYTFSCIIEDVGNGVALITNAMSEKVKLVKPKELKEKLLSLGFKEVRWVRVVHYSLKDDSVESLNDSAENI